MREGIAAKPLYNIKDVRAVEPGLIDHLRAAGHSYIKVTAGGVIPAQDYQALRDAGVQAIFGAGTNLVDAAGEVPRLLGHNLPPGPIENAAA